jgi:hypothetical protein
MMVAVYFDALGKADNRRLMRYAREATTNHIVWAQIVIPSINRQQLSPFFVNKTEIHTQLHITAFIRNV